MQQSELTSVLPWHRQAYADLWRRRDALPHALLVHGPKGTGKRQFGAVLAQSMLCETPMPDRACGGCASCTWFGAGSHPDYRQLEPMTDEPTEEEGAPAKKSSQIVVEQVRALSAFLSVSTHRGGWRPVLIQPAEALNPSAANALLKSLEEPPSQTLFILISHRLHQVLPTIRSRCQLLPLRGPRRAESTRWLESQEHPNAELASAYSGAAPLVATALPVENYWEQRQRFLRHLTAARIDVLAAAEECQDSGIPMVLEWLQKWTYDVAACRLTGRVRYNIDQEAILNRMASACNPVPVLRLHRELVRMQRHAHHPLNTRLFLEQVLMNYAEAAAVRASAR